MAGHGDTAHGNAGHRHDEPADTHQIDIGEHRASYERFMFWAKWGTLVSAIVAFIAVVIVAA